MPKRSDSTKRVEQLLRQLDSIGLNDSLGQSEAEQLARVAAFKLAEELSAGDVEALRRRAAPFIFDSEKPKLRAIQVVQLYRNDAQPEGARWHLVARVLGDDLASIDPAFERLPIARVAEVLAAAQARRHSAAHVVASLAVECGALGVGRKVHEEVLADLRRTLRRSKAK